jgi:hypothetical protein
VEEEAEVGVGVGEGEGKNILYIGEEKRGAKEIKSEKVRLFFNM